MRLMNEEILTLMDYCAKLNITALIHCEEDSIIKYCSKYNSFPMTRPKEAEENMVNTIINFSSITGCRVYICHVSSKKSMELIKKAKAEGLSIFMETCPQYLIFDDNIYNCEGGEKTKYILSPPFRDFSHKEALIKACLDGTVDLISTDHCAFLFKEHKEKYSCNIDKAAKGMPGIQLRSSLMYNLLVIKHGLDIKDYVKLLSYNPAAILGLKDRGYIKAGMKADMVIWSNEKFKVTLNDIEEGTDYSPYEGFELLGKPFYTNIAY
jgi:dihydropyrimidinase